MDLSNQRLSNNIEDRRNPFSNVVSDHSYRSILGSPELDQLLYEILLGQKHPSWSEGDHPNLENSMRKGAGVGLHPSEIIEMILRADPALLNEIGDIY